MAAPSIPSPLPCLGRHRAWQLDPSWAFLNHGSFGARPVAVSRVQDSHRRAFERHPIRVLDDELMQPMMESTLEAVAGFLGVDPAGLVFVPNVSDAIAAVLGSMSFKRGDEILSTTHAYGAVQRAMEATAKMHGAKAVFASVPCPVQSMEEVEACVLDAVTPRTRLAIIDQITSPTALRFDVDRLTRLLKRRGVDVLVDGAHAAGMLHRPVTTSAHWWTSNLHKWGLSPVGCGVLYTHPSRRGITRPTAISHMHFKGYQQAFGWQGTRDVTPWYTAPCAIDWVKAREGWAALRQYNTQLSRWTARTLCDAWGGSVAGPASMRKGVSMVTVELPRAAARWRVPNRLRDALADRFKVEVPIWNDGPRWWLRVSCQAYVRPKHVHRLVDAVDALLLGVIPQR